MWTAGYFNDPDRAFHAMFERYLDEMVPAFRSGAAPPVHARAGARALRARPGLHRGTRLREHGPHRLTMPPPVVGTPIGKNARPDIGRAGPLA